MTHMSCVGLLREVMGELKLTLDVRNLQCTCERVESQRFQTRTVTTTLQFTLEAIRGAPSAKKPGLDFLCFCRLYLTHSRD